MDREFAGTLFVKAAEFGDEEAARILIEKYDGIGDENIDELLKKAEEGDSDSAFIVGRFYLFGMHGIKKNLKKAIRFLEVAAAKGHSNAQCELGAIYNEGMHGIKKDLKLAIKWLKKSADQNDLKGAFNYLITTLLQP